MRIPSSFRPRPSLARRRDLVPRLQGRRAPPLLRLRVSAASPRQSDADLVHEHPAYLAAALHAGREADLRRGLGFRRASGLPRPRAGVRLSRRSPAGSMCGGS